MINMKDIIKITWMFVTRAQADAWLGRNDRNRPMNAQTVAKIARDVTNGLFAQRNAMIAIYEDGTLGDGQHRLKALVTSGAEGAWMLVSFGWPMSTPFDDNQSRSHAQNLHINGEKNCTHLSAAADVLIRYALGQSRESIKTSQSERNGAIAAFPSLRESVTVSRTYPGSLSASYVAALHCLTHIASPTVAENFFAKLASGAGMVHGDPALAICRRFLASKKTNKIGNFRSTFGPFNTIARAWAAAINERPMAQASIGYEAKMIEVVGAPATKILGKMPASIQRLAVEEVAA